MRIIKIIFVCVAALTLTNCASGYQMIQPTTLNYLSTNESDGVTLEYKYNLLEKKYEKKEIKKGVKLVAIKITNNSGKDIMFGKDARLVYENGKEIHIFENKKTFKTLKQNVASYLLYLLLSPINLYTTTTNSYGMVEESSSTPIGLILGPGLAGGNMIAAGSANKKFNEELLEYNINGTLIKNGEVKHGLIGIESDSYEGLRLKIE